MPFIPFGCLRVLSVVIVAATILSEPARATEGNKRLALVIGNSGYKNIQALTNPKNDAIDIAAKLKTLKFEVLLGTDATQAQMKVLLAEFNSRVAREDVALVFYAGHGVTINRESFLLPVDVPGVIEADEKGDLRTEAVNSQLVGMAEVLHPLGSAKLGIVFLDACRTDQVKAGVGLELRVASLAPGREAPKLLRGTGSLDIKPSPYSAGVFRAYATQLDNVASDGAGRNSPFTKALLKHIGTSGLSIQELMIRVRKSVMEETRNEQIPWEEAALNESFFFLPPTTRSSTPSKPGPTKSPVDNKLPPNLGVGVGTGL